MTQSPIKGHHLELLSDKGVNKHKDFPFQSLQGNLTDADASPLLMNAIKATEQESSHLSVKD
jgi:hypothetical protein